MGSDLGKGFIVILLSCDLHMIQPLLIWPDSTRRAVCWSVVALGYVRLDL